MNVRRMIGLVMPLLLLATTVGAAPTDGQAKAAERLLQFKVVQGQSLPGGRVDLALEKSLTRAELAVILVRAVGREFQVPVAVATAPYPDVPVSQWHARWITTVQRLAAEKGLALGTAEGNFEPLREVSRAEALVLTLKLLGYKAEGTGAHWYEPWIQLAAKLGVLQASEVLPVMQGAQEPITRGEAFLYLDRILDLPLLNGKVAYDTVLDNTAPVVAMSQDPQPETVMNEVWLAGSVADDRGIPSITVNGVPVTVNPDGWFQSDPIPLTPGINQIQLRAVDRAGNFTVKSWTVNRTCCLAARMEHALYPNFPRVLQPGERVEINLKLYDEQNNLLPPAPYRVITELGTVEDGWFIAGTKAGKGEVQIWALNMESAFNLEIAAGAPASLVVPTVKVGQEIYLQAADKWGNPILGGYWRTGSTGATVHDDGLFKTDVPGRYFVVIWYRNVETTLQIDVTP